MNHYNVVCAVVLDSNQRVLCVRKGATRYPYTSFRWEFPGGKLEAGETRVDALKRELREELDMEVVVGELLETVEYDYPQFHLTMHCYLCQLAKEKFVLKEHEAARWLGKNQLDEVAWLPADEGIVEKLKSILA